MLRLARLRTCAPGAPGGISCNASRIAAAPPSSIAAESAADCAPFSGRPRRGVDDRATGVSGTLAASFDSARLEDHPCVQPVVQG